MFYSDDTLLSRYLLPHVVTAVVLECWRGAFFFGLVMLHGGVSLARFLKPQKKHTYVYVGKLGS